MKYIQIKQLEVSPFHWLRGVKVPTCGQMVALLQEAEVTKSSER
jgi:hypothetical protein